MIEISAVRLGSETQPKPGVVQSVHVSIAVEVKIPLVLRGNTHRLLEASEIEGVHIAVGWARSAPTAVVDMDVAEGANAADPVADKINADKPVANIV